MLEEINLFFSHNSHQIFLYLLNFFVLLILLSLFFFVKKSRNRWDKVNDYLGILTNTVESIRFGNLSGKIEKTDIPDSEHLTESINRMIETLHDREAMVIESQNELYRQNKLLEAVINSFSDGLIIIDEEALILKNTQKISEWFEKDGKELRGQSIFDYIQLSPRKNIKNLEEDEVYIINKKDSNFIASSMELKLDDKKKRFIVIVKNVTDQKELETLKEDFVATLTHDLKVPIIAETNMLELFLSENFGPISEKQKIALKNMQASNKELLDLVQIVLETYKMRDGNIRLFKENIMLKGFIEEIIEEMTPITDKSNNALKFILTRDIRVYADKIQLKRVIKNLITNAASYGANGSPIEIRIGEIPKFIIIAVKDYGAGIAKSDIDKIFNKYYSAAKKFRKIGTGLGLYLAQQIAKAHGGDLTVESVENDFTEFTIKIPAVMNTSLQYGE